MGIGKHKEDSREDVEESLEDFVNHSVRNTDVLGIRVYVEYPLVEDITPKGVFAKVTPTIKCQSTNGYGEIFSQHKEIFERYFPLETKTDPGRIAKIKKKVEGRARNIADYVHSQGLKVSIYTQNPPSAEFLNNVQQR